MGDGRSLNDVKDEVRRDAALRSASVGPLVAITQLLRDYCRLDAELRDVIERLPYELELLDARLRLAYGERWCDGIYEALLRRDVGDDDDPIGRDLSRSRAVRRVAGRACVLCGERDAELLSQQLASVLEDHHIAGKVNDPDLTVTLCLNCHRKMSARMPGYGVPLDRGAQLTRMVCV